MPSDRVSPEWDAPGPTCHRCSKPVTPEAASQVAGRPVHLHCLVQEAELEAVEQQDRAGYEMMRARAAQARAAELIDTVRRWQTRCPVCGERLGTSRGVLFQGDQLVHAACWRDKPEPFEAPPPTR
jgi:hypothetical protein